MRRMVRNEYKVGDLLPSAAALAEEFGVSAITVTRALRDLQPTGMLRSVPGVGTFVRERRRFIRNLDFTFSSIGVAQRLGRNRPIQSTSVTREKIRNPVLSDFDAPTSAMVCIRKMLSVDGTPIMFDTSYLPLTLNDKVVAELGDKSVTEALRDQGTRFLKGRLLIEAAPASEEVQQAFGLPNGYPTVRRLYQLTTGDPSFSIFGITESPFDRLAWTIELDVSQRNR
ncbi:GntR family transcriptional regulator [Bradyrhizobium sp. ma5]|uniref:GntR family transcriptional regulator n=1 Tax=Bradyrhizobium sp. ma5 TaxID=3344828 RepID=UPI0035D3DCDA